MFLAAGLDLGVKLEDLAKALAGLQVAGWRFEVSRQMRHSISGTHLDVVVDEATAAHQHRALKDIRKTIAQALTMPERARAKALAVFEALGVAEAKVHGVPLDQVEFHEVGAVDSIVDICGAAMVLELLGDPEVFSAPPPLGSGTARTAHGPMPIPPPATLELLRELPVKFEGVGELTTPTGAAILKALCKVGAPPELVIEKVGYGVGTRDWPDRANVLRATLGKPAHAAGQGTFVVEANLDDCSPQLLGALVEELLEKGAVDAYV
ncbi:MAG: nickel pincer cofactor biosynthesis protein LarC, partial [Myxococcaceae bacterium]